MKTLLLLLMVFLIPVHGAFAEEIKMSTEQSTYYFTVGENAIIPIEIENNYGESIFGMLQYTITQEIIQGNAQVTSSNTNGSTLTINEGKQKLSLDFGTSNSPSTMNINLNFNYKDSNEINVFLGPIEIIFVSDESQKDNTTNKMQSSSLSGGTTSQNNQLNSQQSMQQKLDELFNKSPLSQDPQQRLQNNQLAQDSNALKQQIHEQLQKESELQTEFEKQIVSNENFQKIHQQMVNEGYSLTQGSINPTTNSTATFEANYENSEGKWGKIEGNLENGVVANIQKHTQQEQENLLIKLRSDPKFQNYEQRLIKEGYFEETMKYNNEQNSTLISIEYQNDEFQTASIIGEFENDELITVKLDWNNTNQFEILPLLIALLIGITIVFLFLKLRVKKGTIEKSKIPKILPQNFDYIYEANKILKEGKESFDRQEFKEAYGKVAQAIRLYLSYKLNLRKEITNENLLNFLEHTSYPTNDIENCFRKSSLVEFAKENPNKNDFKEIVSLAESLINK